MNSFEYGMQRGLKGADFYRLRCMNCGDFTAALPAGQSLPAKCFWCDKQPMHVIHTTIRAMTKMKLPEWTKPRLPSETDQEIARARYAEQTARRSQV